MKLNSSTIVKDLEVSSEEARWLEEVLGLTVCGGVWKEAQFAHNSTVRRLQVETDSLPHHYFVKAHRPSPQPSLNDFFHTETRIFTRVFPVIEKYLKSNDIQEVFWPQLSAMEEKIMFLEDLTVEGYNVLERELELDEALIVIERIGWLHAASLRALQDPSCAQAPRPTADPHHIADSTNFFKAVCSAAAATVRLNWQPRWKMLAEALDELSQQKIGRKIYEISKLTTGKYDVINHGDLWSGNLLFKKRAGTSEKKCKLVDYQICHVNSGAWDLVMFLHSCLMPHTMEKHKQLLLDTYFHAFHRLAPLVNLPEYIAYTKEKMSLLHFYGELCWLFYLPLSVGRSEVTDQIDTNLVASPEGPRHLLDLGFFSQDKVTSALQYMSKSLLSS